MKGFECDKEYLILTTKANRNPEYIGDYLLLFWISHRKTNYSSQAEK